MGIEFSKFFEDVLFHISEKSINDYGKDGTYQHVLNYIRKNNPDKINEKGTIISAEIATDEYITEYLLKDKYNDFSARDCVEMAFVRCKTPHLKGMSVESLEKTVRTEFKKRKGQTYIKLHNNRNVACVDRTTAEEIIQSAGVRELFQKQIEKAEKKADDSVEWRAYEFAKKKMDAIDSRSMEDDANDEYGLILSENNETHLMVKAIFNALFSEFDFEKYEKYQDEMSMLEEDWDFNERFQELYDIFHSPDYKNEFYVVNHQSALLDVLAEKIAEKITIKMQEEES